VGHFNSLARYANDRCIGLSITAASRSHTLIGHLSSRYSFSRSRSVLQWTHASKSPSQSRARRFHRHQRDAALCNDPGPTLLSADRRSEQSVKSRSATRVLRFCIYLLPEIALVIHAECDSLAHPVITAIFVGGSLKIERARALDLCDCRGPAGASIRNPTFTSMRIRISHQSEATKSARAIMAKLLLQSRSPNTANVNPRAIKPWNYFIFDFCRHHWDPVRRCDPSLRVSLGTIHYR